MASNAEEFILKLNQQISGPAGAATGALAQLEAQIRRERDALSGLEKKMADTGAAIGAAEARKKNALAALMAAPVDDKALSASLTSDVNRAIAEIDRLKKARSSLEERAIVSRQSISTLEGGRGLARQADALKASAKAAAENKEAFEATSGPLGGFIGRMEKLGSAIGKGGGVAGAALSAVAAI